MSDEKEPTWPFAVVPHPQIKNWFVVQGPDAYVIALGAGGQVIGTPLRQDAVRLRDVLARVYNLGFDAARESASAQRAYVPGDVA